MNLFISLDPQKNFYIIRDFMRIFLFAFRISKFSGRKKHIIIFVLSLFLKREYFLFSKNTRINYVIYILLFIIDAMYIFFSRSQYFTIENEIETGTIERSKVREPATNAQRRVKDFNWRVCSRSLLFLSLSIYITIHLYLAPLSLLSASSYYRYRLPD